MTRFTRHYVRPQNAIQFVIGLMAVLVWFAPVPHLKFSTPHAPPPPLFATLPADLSSPGMRQLIARPIFAQTRRPPPVATPKAPMALVLPSKPVPTTNGMILLGVLHTSTKAIALVMLPGDSVPRQVGIGAVLGDWVVTKIAANQVFLISGDLTAQLVLPPPSITGNSPESSLNAPPMAFPFSRAP